MSCRLARLVALAALQLAAFSPLMARTDADAGGKRIESRAVTPLVELSSPQRGARLPAGQSVLLAWRAAPALDIEPWIEEWEAFLSLDGGAEYIFRLTPHLDIERRSFSIRLPDVATNRARLMLRLGDERRELEYELPWTFEIVSAEPPPFDLHGWAVGAGEAPRSGAPGVVAWVEGPRNGSRSRDRIAGRSGTEIHRIEPGTSIALISVAPGTPAISLPPAGRFEHPEAGIQVIARKSPTAESFNALAPRDRTCRRNE